MKLYATAVLAISFLDIFNVVIIRGSFGSQILPMNTCVNLNLRELNHRRISSYERQNRPIRAVIFITKNGLRICVPEDLPWVVRTISNLNQRAKHRKPNKTKSTSRPQAISSSAST